MLPIPYTATDRFQLRAYARALWNISDIWSLEGRVTKRYRNYEAPRTDLRTDLRFASGPFLSVLRLEAVKCDSWGFLGYLEGGYKSEVVSAYLRFTGFKIDKWADRIYVYERDAPGSFSVPAYNGRGVSISATGNIKHRFKSFTLKFYLRGAYTFKNGSKPTPVLNLQLMIDI